MNPIHLHAGRAIGRCVLLASAIFVSATGALAQAPAPGAAPAAVDEKSARSLAEALPVEYFRAGRAGVHVAADDRVKEAVTRAAGPARLSEEVILKALTDYANKVRADAKSNAADRALASFFLLAWKDAETAATAGIEASRNSRFAADAKDTAKRGALADEERVLYVIKGTAQIEQGRWQEAEKSFRAACDLAEKGKDGPWIGARMALGKLLNERGDAKGSETAWKELVVAHDAGERKLGGDLDDALCWQALTLRMLGKFDEAITVVSRAVEEGEKTYGANSRRIYPSLYLKSLLLRDSGKKREGMALLDDAINLEKRTARPTDEDDLETLIHVAAMQSSRGDLRIADRTYRHALDVAERRRGPNDLSLTWMLAQMADFANRSNQLPMAEQLARRAKQIADQFPDRPEGIFCDHHLARVLGSLGRFRQACELLRPAVDRLRKVQGDESPEVGLWLSELGSYLVEDRQPEAAEKYLREALEVYKKSVSMEHPRTAELLGRLGNLLMGQRRPKEAQEVYERAVEIYEKSMGADTAALVKPLVGLGQATWQNGRPLEAKKVFVRATEIARTSPQATSRDVIVSNGFLAEYLEACRDHAGAEKLMRVSLGLIEREMGKGSREYVNAIGNLAVVLRGKADFEAAAKMFQEAVELGEKMRGPGHPDTNVCRGHLGGVLHELKRDQEAEPILRKAVEVEEALGRGQTEILAQRYNELGIALMAMGKPECEKHFRRSIEIAEAAKSAVDLGLALGNLAKALDFFERMQEAEEVSRRYLAHMEKAFGPESAQAGRGCYRLAQLCWKLAGKSPDKDDPAKTKARKTEARELIQRAVTCMTNARWGQHPGELETVRKLAEEYGKE